ncbi:MAG TPA: hypothetical protein PLB18_10905 [Acidobacteriota bacterium]|nr:hypothetical protein [Acidobacteriota bacterium]HNG95370.1 hypothetical protein [Acidobacteriota bacterium]HNJ41943.1 hypothetical protein [Acidobacteriota bacterium]
MLNHPDVLAVALMKPRTFHICSAHQKARDVLKAGKIPADFTCPYASKTCPLLTILQLDPGKSLYLSGTGSPKL